MLQGRQNTRGSGGECALTVSKHHTLIILDWDDTLLPTSWLARHNLNLDSSSQMTQEESEQLRAIDAVAASLIRKAAFLYGQVLIITNAQQGWVELSSEKFMPETHKLIFSELNEESDISSVRSFSSSSSGFSVEAKRKRDNPFVGYPDEVLDNLSISNLDCKRTEQKITVVSARNMYESEFPNSPSQWKRKAFATILRNRIDKRFIVPETAHSDSEAFSRKRSFESYAEKQQPCKRIRRCNSDLSSLDLNSLIEVNTEEVEHEFSDTASLTSTDFRLSVIDDFEWKELQESNEAGDYFPMKTGKERPCCNLISVGDASHDCDSLQELELALKDVVKKTVKFRNFPTIDELSAQIRTLDMRLDALVLRSSSKHFDGMKDLLSED